MCGIFGFSFEKSISTEKVFRLLQKLETHQLPEEKSPLGGFGAGVAILLDDGSVLVEKVGKKGKSPAGLLPEIVKVKKARVLLGHVRMPSPEFMSTANLKETAQPYVVERDPNLTVASVHNGKMENYREVRSELGREHVFESEKSELIDSEVIPHYFEEILSEKEDVRQAVYEYFCALKGPNAVALLQVGEENSFIHLFHKGLTRGLSIWTNDRNELVFCSRRAPLIEEFSTLLARRRFREKVFIRYHEDIGLILSHQLLSK